MWRYAGASVIGSSHVSSGAPCQDAHHCTLFVDEAGETIVVLAAADGAGTAARAERGAELAARTFAGVAEARLRTRCFADFDDPMLREILAEARAAIAAEADTTGAPLRDYACTLLAAIVGERSAAFCQIGDGAIIVAERGDEDWCWVFWPQKGEFANATSFLTDDDALATVETSIGPRNVEEIAVLTDGMEKLVLKYDTQSVFAPFFQTMFPPIRAVLSPGEDAALSSALRAYLGSDVVNRRTDDDKTLVLATRRRLENGSQD